MHYIGVDYHKKYSYVVASLPDYIEKLKAEVCVVSI